MTRLTGHTALQQYSFLQHLGRGGMSDVYKVWDRQRGVYLAAKVLRRDLVQDRDLLRRFQQEAAVLEKLQHPYIVRFCGLEREGSMIFILMEYIAGQNLRKMLLYRSAPLDGYEVLRFLRPVVAGLQYAHQKNIFHCDVKASNVIVGNTGRVCIGDFGIARIVGGESIGAANLGTPTHMAPEQCSGEDVDARTDVYGLGVTLYEMITGGYVPFTGDTKSTSGTRGERIRFQHLHVPPPSPRMINSNLPVEVEDVILRALNKSPSNRFSSAMTLLEALETAYQASSSISSAPDTEKCKKPTMSPVPAMLIVRRGEWVGHVFRFQKGLCHIGRNRFSDVRLSHRAVSRRHAVIRWASEHFWLQDEDSLHGTYLNGRRIRAQRLRTGDLIQIGDNLFEFRVVDAKRGPEIAGRRMVWQS